VVLVEVNGAKPSVLAVEDKPKIPVLAESIIEAELGYNVLSAANARQALAVLEQHGSIAMASGPFGRPTGSALGG
jgi:CheY-like chemotaxis protein